MAYIKVDHSKFESAATAVDNYVTLMKNKMKSAQSEVNTLSSSWQGSDFAQFKKEFNKVDDKDSTHNQMLKAMESYSKYLRFAANKYKDAQSRAVNRANSLPRW